MSNYEKMAITVIRVVGLLSATVGVMGFLYLVISSLILGSTSPDYAWQGARSISSLIFIIMGLIFYFLSGFLGRLAAKGIN